MFFPYFVMFNVPSNQCKRACSNSPHCGCIFEKSGNALTEENQGNALVC